MSVRASEGINLPPNKHNDLGTKMALEEINHRESDVRRYLFEYPYEGSEYALEIPAVDEAEAKARLMAIPWAKYKGEITATIPLNPLRWWHWRR